MAEKPSDIGGDDNGYDFPGTERPAAPHHRRVCAGIAWRLFGAISVRDGYASGKAPDDRRSSARCADIAGGKQGCQTVIWVDTDYESEAVAKLLPDAAEIRGSQSIEVKERHIEFLDGTRRRIITKPSMCGLGLNLPQCADTISLAAVFRMSNGIKRCGAFGDMGEPTRSTVI